MQHYGIITSEECGWACNETLIEWAEGIDDDVFVNDPEGTGGQRETSRRNILAEMRSRKARGMAGETGYAGCVTRFEQYI